MALPLLCTVCSVLTPVHDLPPYLWELLGTNIVITPQAFDKLRSIDKPYQLVDRVEVINKQITGAIVAGDDPTLGIQIAWVTLQRGWYSKASVVVLATTADFYVFSVLWYKGKIANVVYLTTKGLYIYNPFLKSILSVGEHIGKNLTDRWIDQNGNQVGVSVYENPISFDAGLGISLGSGLDGSALYELSKYWNITVKLRVNDKMNYSEFQVLRGKSDLSIAGLSLFQNTFGLHLTSIVYGDNVCVVLRLPPKLRGWDVLWRIYDRKVYAAFIISIFITNKAFRLIAKKNTRKNTLQMVIRTMSNVTIVRPPTAFRERILLTSTMIFGLIIVTVYQASMFHFVRFNVRHHEMKTLLDVFRSEIPIRTNEIGLKDFFVPWDRKEIRKMGRKIKEEKDVRKALTFGGVVVREKYYELLRDANLLQKDVYVLKQRVGSFTMAYTVKRGSPYLEPLTKFTLRIFEAGLYRKWRRMTVSEIARYYDTSKTAPSQRGLQMSDTEVAFVVLFIGHGLALVVFLLELLVKYRSRIQFRKIWCCIKKVLNIIF